MVVLPSILVEVGLVVMSITGVSEGVSDGSVEEGLSDGVNEGVSDSCDIIVVNGLLVGPPLPCHEGLQSREFMISQDAAGDGVSGVSTTG